MHLKTKQTAASYLGQFLRILYLLLHKLQLRLLQSLNHLVHGQAGTL